MPTALLALFKAHSRARWRRLQTAFSTPRRTLLSLLVLVLVIVWTGQTVASVLLRNAYDPDVFRRWVAVPLFAWFLWHIVRVAWKRPGTAIEWSDEEAELIVGGPFSVREQLAYRFVVILTATLPKAMLTFLVLLPDLSWCSPIGLILALVGLELFRMVMDIGTCCLNNSNYRRYRVAVVVLIGLLAFACRLPEVPASTGTSTADIVAQARNQQASHYVDSLLQNEIVATFAVPFLWAADVIAAHGTIASLTGKMAVMLVSLAAMAWLITVLESLWRRNTIRHERELWGGPDHVDPAALATATAQHNRTFVLPKIPFCGPLVWRQYRRAMQYRGSLLISMAIPVLLLSPSLFSIANPIVAFLLVVSGALFYTFVLLPEAIKFDFRLDSDHLCQLKQLPMTPTRVVLGQLAIPIGMAFVFQATIFVTAGMYRSIDWSLILAATALSLPLTILFVALDNLTFLLYPHRPTQEGFEAFLRTILKFTGKSVLLALFAAAIFVWAPLAANIATGFGLDSPRWVFATGLLVGICGLGTAAVGSVISAFRRFDVSLHGIT